MQIKRLTDGYKFNSFKTMQVVQGIGKYPDARIIKLKRLQKKVYAAFVENIIELIMIRKQSLQEIFHVETWKSILSLKYAELNAKRQPK